VSDGVLVKNVAAGVQTPKLQHHEVAALTATEMHRLFKAAVDGRNGEQHRLQALWVAACYLGAREGELLGLKWSDIDWSARRVTIQRNLVRVGNGQPVFSGPKTRAGLRTFIMPRPAVDVLRAHQGIQQMEQVAAGANYANHNLVFCTPTGNPLNARNVIRLFEAVRDRAKLSPDLTFHALRHTCASMLLSAGVPLPEVAQILGHASTQVTATIYAHVIARSTQHAADRLEQWVTEQTGGLEAA
jgi:integrase